MASAHRAYVFDYDAFDSELRPVLEEALRANDPAGLRSFIRARRPELKDPYAGEPLEEDWGKLLELDDPQEYGDFALTRYYDPAADLGLGDDWPAVQELLVSESNAGTVLTLGRTVGPPTRPFDPGGFGSYFMTADEARERLESLRQLLEHKPALAPRLGRLVVLFETVVGAGRGAYHTF